MTVPLLRRCIRYDIYIYTIISGIIFIEILNDRHKYNTVYPKFQNGSVGSCIKMW